MDLKIQKSKYDSGNVEHEAYYLNTLKHREDGPAFIYYSEEGNIIVEAYFINGRKHREDGPAYIRYENNKDKIIDFIIYYFNDREVSESEFLIHKRKRKLKTLS